MTDMKPEQKHILMTIFNNDGEMGVPEVLRLLNTPSQETEYHLDELKKRDFIELSVSPYDVATLGGRSNDGVYKITEKGRAHVIEELKPNENS